MFHHSLPKKVVTTIRLINDFVCAFMTCDLGINSNGGFKLGMWNLALQPKNISYLHHHNNCGHQTWQGGDLPWGAPTHKAKLPFDHVVFQDQVLNYKYISTIRVPIATKLNSVLTYLDGLLHVKSHDTLIKWTCKIKWQTINIISELPHCL